MKPDAYSWRPWEVTTLGTGGVGASPTRGYPGLLLRIGSHRTLIDAGDGTFGRLARWDSLRRLDLIVLTAVTTERVGGLATLLDSSVHGIPRHPPLVIGPVGVGDAIRGLGAFMSSSAHVSEIVEVDDVEQLSIGDATLHIATVDDGRPGASLGVRLTEPDSPGRFNAEEALRLGVESGSAFGRLAQGESVDGVEPHQVVGPPRPGRTLTVLGPCRPTQRASEQAKDSLALFVVAPYTDERQEIAVEGGVMTGAEAALLASTAQVTAVVMLHLAAMTKPGYARREAGQFHTRLSVPNDGDRFVLPLPDSGGMTHAPASGRGR